MTRRSFLLSASLAALPAHAQQRWPLGFNTYCLRAWRWPDARMLEFAVEQRLDAVFMQDSLDPKAFDPEHCKEIGKRAAELGLHLESGGPALVNRNTTHEKSVAAIRQHLVRAKGLGSKLLRVLFASDRAGLPDGPVEQHIESFAKIVREVRNEVLDAGMKLACETHKDLQAWEFKQLVEYVGKDILGIYLDTGNPVFVHEHPLTTIETLGSYVVTLHLRDSIVYRNAKGVAVQWVPLGEGTYDWKLIMAAIQKHVPPVHLYVKPITGRPPQTLPVFDETYWKLYPKARGEDFARFLALADKGQPYEGHVVIEDLAGRATPEPFQEAVRFQQKEHMERSIRYAQQTLGLGRKAHS